MGYPTVMEKRRGGWCTGFVFVPPTVRLLIGGWSLVTLCATQISTKEMRGTAPCLQLSLSIRHATQLTLAQYSKDALTYLAGEQNGTFTQRKPKRRHKHWSAEDSTASIRRCC